MFFNEDLLALCERDGWSAGQPSLREHAIIVNNWSSTKQGETQPHFINNPELIIFTRNSLTHLSLRIRQLFVQSLKGCLVWLKQCSTIHFSPI